MHTRSVARLKNFTLFAGIFIDKAAKMLYNISVKDKGKESGIMRLFKVRRIERALQKEIDMLYSNSWAAVDAVTYTYLENDRFCKITVRYGAYTDEDRKEYWQHKFDITLFDTEANVNFLRGYFAAVLRKEDGECHD